MRYGDIPPWARHEVFVRAAENEDAKLFSRRIRGIVNQIKCGKLPVSVLDEIESNHGDKWKMVAAARREVLGDS